MILSEYVDVRLSSYGLGWYRKKGYIIKPRKLKYKTQVDLSKNITVKVSDLPRGSAVEIDVQCEDCEKVYTRTAKGIFITKYYKLNKEIICAKCSQIRKRDTKYRTPYKVSPLGHYTSLSKYGGVKRSAKVRGIEFKLTKDEFYSINKNPCHYCGNYSKKFDVTSLGNGLDRKDSSKGYVKGNIVSSCAVCNRVKHSMSYEDFLGYATRLYETTKDLKRDSI